MTDQIQLFYCYAEADEQLQRTLHPFLRSSMRELGSSIEWHDRNISAEMDWATEIDAHLDTASIILLLVSVDFITSDYCYGIEMKRALERHTAGEALVIPIILRPVYWHNAPFGKLQALPEDGKPVTSWANRDEVFFRIAETIREVVKQMIPAESPQKIAAQVREAAREYNALARMHPSLYPLREQDGSLLDLVQVGVWRSGLASVHLRRGEQFLESGRYKKALEEFEEAIRLDPLASSAYRGRGRAYEMLAQQTYETLKQQAHACHEAAGQLRIEESLAEPR
jgi:hypothetical protein